MPSLISEILREKLDVVVVCFGGCGSNVLVRTLERNGFKTRSPIWDTVLCHCPEVVDPVKGVKFIYLYRDFEDAFLSMKNRGPGIWDVNQYKLSNGKTKKEDLSDENLKNLMKNQYGKWTNAAKERDDIMTIDYKILFKPEGQFKIEEYLGLPLENYPKPNY